MDISIRTTLLLTISCSLWTTEGREYNDVISVTNGGQWGSWGNAEFCSNGYAVGFSLKVHKEELSHDHTGLNGISLDCSDGTLIKPSEGWEGTWTAGQNCPSGYLISFSLRVQEYQGRGDDTAANNIQFSCSDGTKLFGYGMVFGEFGEWSPPCPSSSFICGLQTRMEEFQWLSDDTTLNDVRFFCCK